jgi:hypothetical protein
MIGEAITNWRAGESEMREQKEKNGKKRAIAGLLPMKK